MRLLATLLFGVARSENCTTSYECGSEKCTVENAKCIEGQETYDKKTYKCSPCKDTADCKNFKFEKSCVDTVCVSVNMCSDAKDCKDPKKPFCPSAKTGDGSYSSSYEQGYGDKPVCGACTNEHFCKSQDSSLPFCSKSGACTSCKENAHCKTLTESKCLAECGSATCSACAEDADCSHIDPNLVCRKKNGKGYTGAKECMAECTTDADCPMSKPVCKAETDSYGTASMHKKCMPCTVHNDCSRFSELVNGYTQFFCDAVVDGEGKCKPCDSRTASGPLPKIKKSDDAYAPVEEYCEFLPKDTSCDATNFGTCAAGLACQTPAPKVPEPKEDGKDTYRKDGDKNSYQKDAKDGNVNSYREDGDMNSYQKDDNEGYRRLMYVGTQEKQKFCMLKLEGVDDSVLTQNFSTCKCLAGTLPEPKKKRGADDEGTTNITLYIIIAVVILVVLIVLAIAVILCIKKSKNKSEPFTFEPCQKSAPSSDVNRNRGDARTYTPSSPLNASSRGGSPKSASPHGGASPRGVVSPRRIQVNEGGSPRTLPSSAIASSSPNSFHLNASKQESNKVKPVAKGKPVNDVNAVE